MFDRLERKRQQVESRFGDELCWKRMDERKSSRISYAQPFDGSDTQNWPEMIAWLRRHVVKLDEAFSGPLGRLNQQLRSRGGPTVGEGDVAASAPEIEAGDPPA